MKVLRFYQQKAGRFFQKSVLVPEGEELDTPMEFASISMNIDPFRSLETSAKESMVASFKGHQPFLLRLQEIKHYISILESMFNEKP